LERLLLGGLLVGADVVGHDLGEVGRHIDLVVCGHEVGRGTGSVAVLVFLLPLLQLLVHRGGDVGPCVVIRGTVGGHRLRGEHDGHHREQRRDDGQRTTSNRPKMRYRTTSHIGFLSISTLSKPSMQYREKKPERTVLTFEILCGNRAAPEAEMSHIVVIVWVTH